jgi:hypothetical protein
MARPSAWRLMGLIDCGFMAHMRSCSKGTKEIARETGKRTRHQAVVCRQRWRDRFRRLRIRWEKKPEHHLAFLCVARDVIALPMPRWVIWTGS